MPGETGPKSSAAEFAIDDRFELRVWLGSGQHNPVHEEGGGTGDASGAAIGLDLLAYLYVRGGLAPLLPLDVS